MSRPTALVTGASRGIGLAVAEDLARTHDVVLVGRSGESLQRVADDLPGASVLVLDVAEEHAVDSAVLPDHLDVVVHAAGISEHGTVEEVSRGDWRQVFETNVFGVAHLTARALPALRAASGTVVLVNSGAGLFSTPGNSVYSASKFALRTFGDCLREEERENGVRVVSIHPGIVDTDMGRAVLERREGGRPERMIAPETIAAAVRTAVDAPPEAQFETVSIRPTLDPKGP
ncbi:SDR family oxidoreductase [Aeromicrobium sp. 50.2.37]|uniref:SDR family oxidoreductase n=1 Tax=Aeromicrobium sp. 50.2.37 TaxID=2969305 RepID=UPI00214F696A|nr:SDR family oxidoreductase [Aeromicrobium sp. 50.2.37]MCR4511950.1 SDR family oxidoreductase [Aeromicrobium sp. 50.2.37]